MNLSSAKVFEFSLSIVVTLLFVSACGGGSSDSAAGTSLQTVSLSKTSISLQADTAVNGVPSADLQLIFSGAQVPNYYISFSWNNTAVQEVQQLVGGGIPDNNIHVSLYRPGQLGAGSYTDEILVRVCVDAACAQQFPGSPMRIPVSLRVTGSASVLTTFELQLASIRANGHTGDSAAPRVTANLLVDNSPPQGVYVRWLQPSGTVISNVAFQESRCSINCAGTIAWGSFTFTLRPPNQFLSGSYTDNFTLELCFDQACTRHLPNSPLTIPARYAIYLTEGREYATRIVSLPATDVAWNPQNQRLYATVVGLSIQNPARITEIDPNTGALGASLTFGSNPTRLVISDDGQFAYVALPEQRIVQRVRLPSLTPDITIPMGLDSTGSQLNAGRMAVAPGAARTLAVALRTQNGAESGGVVVFDDAAARPQSIAPLGRETYNTVAWGDDASILYLARSAYPPTLFNLDAVNVSSSGLSIATVYSDVLFQPGYWIHNEIYYAGGRIYENSGRVYDPTTGAAVGAFELLPSNGVTNPTLVPDAALGKTFALYRSDSNSVLSIFDNTNFQLVGQALPSFDTLPPNSHLIRWGTNGLAFANGTSVAIISGSMVGL